MFQTTSFQDFDAAGCLKSCRIVEIMSGGEQPEPFECILFEPPGKTIDPRGYVTTGLVVCLHGMPPSNESLQEWGKAVELAGWLDLGVSVAVPNVQMSASLQVGDFDSMVDNICAAVGFDRCLVVGKGWGAQRAAELAMVDALERKVDGIVLVAPTSPSPSPEDCAHIRVPALLVWAQDDEVCPFADSGEWIKALDRRAGPTSFVESGKGGHALDGILEADDAAAAALRNFTVSVFLIGHLEEAVDAAEGAGAAADAGAADPMVAQRAVRLSTALPDFLSKAISEAGGSAEVTPVSSKGARKLSDDLQHWIQGNMLSAAE